jgi:two-component system OmpR family response regulator
MTNPSVLKNILYVDDDPDLQKIVQLSLQSKGEFTVQVCDSGMEAIAKVKESQPDLIILDVVMREMDGPETLLELQKLPEAADIPVIFMTSRVRPEKVKRYKEIGAVGVIEKPFQPRKLADQVRKLWNQMD